MQIAILYMILVSQLFFIADEVVTNNVPAGEVPSFVVPMSPSFFELAEREFFKF